MKVKIIVTCLTSYLEGLIGAWLLAC